MAKELFGASPPLQRVEPALHPAGRGGEREQLGGPTDVVLVGVEHRPVPRAGVADVRPALLGQFLGDRVLPARDECSTRSSSVPGRSGPPTARPSARRSTGRPARRQRPPRSQEPPRLRSPRPTAPRRHAHDADRSPRECRPGGRRIGCAAASRRSGSSSRTTRATPATGWSRWPTPTSREPAPRRPPARCCRCRPPRSWCWPPSRSTCSSTPRWSGTSARPRSPGSASPPR